MSRVVIVGASVGGLKTAQALRSEGFEGEIVLIDQERHPTYDKPPLSKKYLTGETARHEIELLSEHETRGIGAISIFGTPAASLNLEGQVVTLEDGTAVSYDTLVIATGSRARRSPWGEGEHIHLLRTSGDAERLRDELATARHLVVIGAGFIGGEAAATAITAGVRVSMVDPFPAPMSRVLNAEVGQIFSRKYAQEGVEEYFGRTVEGVEQTADGVRVVLDGGEIIEADAALVGIGAVVNTEWLEGSGIELDNGVTCDSGLRAIGILRSLPSAISHVGRVRRATSRCASNIGPMPLIRLASSHTTSSTLMIARTTTRPSMSGATSTTGRSRWSGAPAPTTSSSSGPRRTSASPYFTRRVTTH